MSHPGDYNDKGASAPPSYEASAPGYNASAPPQYGYDPGYTAAPNGQYPQQPQYAAPVGQQPYSPNQQYPPQQAGGYQAYPQSPHPQQPSYTPSHYSGGPAPAGGYPQQPAYGQPAPYAGGPGYHPPPQGGSIVITTTQTQTQTQSQSQGQNQAAPRNPKLEKKMRERKWEKIMEKEFCECFKDPVLCCLSCYFPCCLFGYTYSQSEQGPCCIGCCFYPCLCGISRNSIQSRLGTTREGCVFGCVVHYFCRCCALTQESRAVSKWVKAGRPHPVANSAVTM